MNKMNRSVARAIDIIDLIAGKREAMTIAEISKELDIPKSTAFDIIYTLVDKGYFEIADSKNKTYRLGMKLFQAGSSYLESASFYDIAHPMLEEVMIKAQDTAFLAVANEASLVYLDKAESTSSVRTSARIGSSNPLYRTGLGKAILAAYPEEKVRQLMEICGFEAKTPYTITTIDRLLRELRETRVRGYAIDNKEGQEEVFCVAAPVYNAAGEPFAAISIASLVSKMENHPERIDQFGELIADTALNLSHRIGFRGEILYTKE